MNDDSDFEDINPIMIKMVVVAFGLLIKLGIFILCSMVDYLHSVSQIHKYMNV